MPAQLPQMKRVYSSHIDRVGYDEDSGQLHVHWSNGSEGFYEGVSARNAASVLAAPSIGEELHRIIRGAHQFSYVKKVRRGGGGFDSPVG